MDVPHDASGLNLENSFLIATPAMQDPRFRNAVIYMCAHDAGGAMGIVVNKPKRGPLGGPLSLSDLLEDVGVEGEPKVADIPVLDGGPVDINRGFVIHTGEYQTPEGTMPISDTLMLTSTRDVLDALVTERAPARAVMAIGYAGWGEGQIEDEIAANAWIVCAPDDPAVHDRLVFGEGLSDKWSEALGVVGIDPAHLSAFGGSA